MSSLRIATRRSPLALWQAEHVAERLRRRHPELEVLLVPMTTRGDRLLDAPLAKVGGKGLFLKELEKALIEDRADIAVHSMKDVTVELPPGLHLPVITAREDPRDALLCPRSRSLDALPVGARLGTSSLRRKCQLLRLRPDLDIVNLRGGVHTRLKKLDAGEYDAIVLASAGLRRLGLAARIAEYLAPERLLPAVGQGALGIECRVGDTRAEDLIASLNDPESAARVRCERAMNRRLGGGCQVPIAGYAERRPGRWWLRGLVSRIDGAETILEEASTHSDDVEGLGSTVAEALLARGAGEFLDQAYADA